MGSSGKDASWRGWPNSEDQLASSAATNGSPTSRTSYAAGSLKGGYPLSSKLTTVLSASYADSEFRDALSLLDERAITNSAKSRRQLRLDLHKEVLDRNGVVVDEFGRIADQLRKIKVTMDKLNENYNDMRAQIHAAKATTSAVLDEASHLVQQRQQNEARQRLLRALRERFVLTEDEVAVLTLTSEPVDEDFFSALSKAERISHDCEVLLGFENQTLGLEMMEQISKQINQAFQKLYRWIQREFKTLNLENPQIGSAIRRGLRVLAQRPSLFQSSLTAFAEARQQVLSDSFYTALTGTSTSGVDDQSVKPIELAAHDPLRYVGDMLAWTHSAAVGEKEALEALFIADGEALAKGIQAGRDNEVWRLVVEEGEEAPAFDALRELNHLVDQNISGAVRLLRQRVEQVIQNNEDTILAYRLANLLNFYRITFSKLLSEDCALIDSLKNIEAEALRQFRSLMRDHIANVQGEFRQTPPHLEPPGFLLEALEQLQALMKTYDTSLVSSDDRGTGFEPILQEALDPFVMGCEHVAEGIPWPESAIFSLNCLNTVIATLSSFDFTTAHSRQFVSQVDTRSDQLIDSQYNYFCHESGLKEIIEAARPFSAESDDLNDLIRMPCLQPEALSTASQQLDDFLPSGLLDALEILRQLQDATMAREITEHAAERFCVEFEHVEELLIAADKRAGKTEAEEPDRQSLRAVFPRTSGELRVLLS